MPAAKKRSWLPLLLLLTDVAWIATYLVSMGLNGWAFENLKLNPMAGSSAKVLSTLGAVDYDKVVNAHQWWRIVAAPFLCSGQTLIVHTLCLLPKIAAAGAAPSSAAPAMPACLPQSLSTHSVHLLVYKHPITHAINISFQS